MRREAWTKLALGVLGVCTGGGLAGLGLANYTASGSFQFYQQRAASEWRPVEKTVRAPDEPGFGSAYRSVEPSEEPRPEYASFVD